MADADWKTRLGVQINYSPSQSSEEDDVGGVTIERRWRAMEDICSEYDHLGSTPPRTRIRNKEKYKSYVMGDINNMGAPRVPRRNTTDNFQNYDAALNDAESKRSKRRSLKLLRGSERDLKLDIERCKSCRENNIPTKQIQISTIPTLVESCNRFMSLSSRPVHTGREQSCPPDPVAVSSRREEYHSHYQQQQQQQLERSQRDGHQIEDQQMNGRVAFHNMFSILIRMGNSEKNCKRTMSVEEHTWQNELKDLVWLEVCAKRAGRTPTQQDAFLCSKRDEVPALLQDILQYKFINTGQKCTGEAIWFQGKMARSDSGVGSSSVSDGDTTPGITSNACECLCINCNNCSMSTSRAMREVLGLLDALTEAEALYPSTKAMAAHHPVILTQDFISKTKAMCLWYNMVHHQRLLMLIIKKLLINNRWRGFTKPKTDKDSDMCTSTSTISNDSCTVKSQPKVKFSIEPFDNEEAVCTEENETLCTAIEKPHEVLDSENDQVPDDETDLKHTSNVHIEITTIQSTDSLLSVIPNIKESQVKTNLLSVGLVENEQDRSSKEVHLSNSDIPKSPYESADSSAGSINSMESGFVSSVYDTADDNRFHSLEKFNVFELGFLGDLTKLRLFYPDQASPYRDYIEKMLKIRGIRRALYFLEKLHLVVLKKTRMTLEKMEDIIKTGDIQSEDDPNPIIEIDGDHENSDDDFEIERHARCEVNITELKKEYIDLRRYGAWSKETIEMNLPSYRSLFLFLSTIPLENIHEFLSMKLETKPDKPSLLSIKQLISELRDGLTIAVRIRARFVRHSQTALVVEPEDSVCRKFFAKVLDTFDNTMDEVYKLYLSYLSDWAGMEHLPRATLAAEWAFNGYLARSLRPAARLAPLTFCCLTVRQLDGAASRLKKRVIELGEAANQLADVSQSDDTEFRNSMKWKILSVCRDMQCLLTEERERTLSTAQFGRTVSMHLHHNVIFRDYRQKIYKAMAHVQNVLCWTIDKMQETTSVKRLMELEESDRPSVQSRTREIVSQAYKFGFEFHKEMCRLINDTLSPESSYNPCARNSLTQNRRSKLVRAESVNENYQNSIEENLFFLNTPTTTNQEFSYPNITNKMAQRKTQKEYDMFSSNLYRSGYKNFQQSYIKGSKFPSFDSIVAGVSLADLNHDDFKNGIPGCEQCNRSKSENSTSEGRDEVDVSCAKYSSMDKDNKACDWEETVSRSLVKFSKQWMNFAMERCERGRGLRPRWANHGLEFLMLTCDPQHTKHLSDQEFEELKEMMDSCITHVIGSSSNAGSAISTPTGTIGIATPPRSARPSVPYSQYPFANRSFLASSPPTTFSEVSSIVSSSDESVRKDKRTSALQELDCRRDAALRKAGVIGSVRQGTACREHFRPRPVTFKWQRGNKIGQGRFGKVYTVVNTETGQLLAMKEVSLGLGDRRAVERAANELQVLEGVMHPNLVRYYGVEIHREEMLIFMELCVEGSLEALIADVGGGVPGAGGGEGEVVGGLPEQLVRRYTSQLVCAVRALHVRAIAHRDIKSGNIFLTEGGNCLKLGDFGCAVKIRANTTVPGELQGYIGTQAYMAPEVFMKSSGHGRAADIWSLGCVVVEMSSGKRPWNEYDSNYQIMFVVGMGAHPEPPSWLSPEGTDFCMSCLQHDPLIRATIDTLSHHNFIKSNQHEDF